MRAHTLESISIRLLEGDRWPAVQAISGRDDAVWHRSFRTGKGTPGQAAGTWVPEA